jgi:hypothetical protein
MKQPRGLLQAFGASKKRPKKDSQNPYWAPSTAELPVAQQKYFATMIGHDPALYDRIAKMTREELITALKAPAVV